MKRAPKVSGLGRLVPPEAETLLADAIGFRRDLDQYGLEIPLVRRACSHGEPEAIDELCEFLISKLKKRRDLERAGHNALVLTKGHIPDRLIGRLAHKMLQKCRDNAIPPTRRLCDLFGQQLVPGERAQKATKRPIEWILAIHYCAENPDANSKTIADALGLAPSTIVRWKRKPDFERLVEAVRADSNRSRSKRNSPR